jgi:preprotein translocase subunit SecE
VVGLLLVGNGEMGKTSPNQFVRQVRQEASKIVWPTRREAGLTTLTVFVMVVIASLFFVLVDQVSAFIISQLLGLGR